MKEYISLIRKTKMFSSFTEKEVMNNLNKGIFVVAKYDKGNIIHIDGEKCNKLEVIVSGKVTVDRIDKAGNLFTISQFEDDDMLGGNLLFSKNAIYPMTVSSQSKLILVEIKKEYLFKLFHDNPAFLKSFLEYVSDHSSMLGNKIKKVVNKTIRESIINYLKHEQKNQNTNHIVLDTTKKMLAEKMGVQRTSLSRELSKMKSEGIIDFDSKSITILTNDL